jgi:hypothetical protein
MPVGVIITCVVLALAYFAYPESYATSFGALFPSPMRRVAWLVATFFAFQACRMGISAAMLFSALSRGDAVWPGSLVGRLSGSYVNAYLFPRFLFRFFATVVAIVVMLYYAFNLFGTMRVEPLSNRELVPASALFVLVLVSGFRACSLALDDKIRVGHELKASKELVDSFRKHP